MEILHNLRKISKLLASQTLQDRKRTIVGTSTHRLEKTVRTTAHNSSSGKLQK